MDEIKRYFWLFSLLMSTVLLISCDSGDQSEALVGQWDPDPNYATVIFQFNEDGTYARYHRGRRDVVSNAGTYTFDGSHIELIGTGGPSGHSRCNGDREYFEVSDLEENTFTIKILVDECHGPTLAPDPELNIKSDVIILERCIDEPIGDSILFECIPVEGE